MKSYNTRDKLAMLKATFSLPDKLNGIIVKKNSFPVFITTLVFSGILTLSTTVSFAQTTYYSRNSATAPRNWNESDSWTLNSDGTGPEASVPGRDDHVVILNGHTIIINATNANGSTGVSPEDIGVIDVGGGDETFPSSGSTMFYQKGNVTANSGGTLSATVPIILEGATYIDGTLTTNGDFVNLGRLDANVGSSLSIGDDFILAGNSETEINITSTGADDIYFDHSSALLCGSGSLDLQGGGSAIQDYNGADPSLQVCSDFTITGCPTCPFSGTGSFTLPIDLIEFKVTDHQLYWDVFQYEVYAFQIQFSLDAQNWEPVGEVDSKGDGRKQYSYPVRETGYYRIMSMEDNPDYSWPVFYRSNEHTLTMFPNRIQSGANLTVQGYEIDFVEVINISGVVQKTVPQNFENITLDVRPGMYVVRVHEAVGVSTRKLMVY